MSESEPASILLSSEENRLVIAGRLSVREVNQLILDTGKILSEVSGKFILLNLDKLDYIDSAGVTALYFLIRKYEEDGLELKLEGGKDEIQKNLELFRPEEEANEISTIRQGIFENIGTRASSFFKEFIMGYLQLAADITYWSLHDLFNKPLRRKGEFVNQAVLIGVNAVLIVASMSFIIGLVIALQSAAQLRSFGANIYIVDLIVISMMCEMGPLITAIMVAGRSGSSIAAEIATMKVTREIDALRTMGLNPLRFVIVPKMHGAIVTLPFLTIIADIMGIAGGLVIAVTSLDISPVVFIHRMQKSLYMKDIIFSFIKSFAFAYIIVITGSFFGFRVEQGAEGVGKVTTTAVVVTLTLVIIADSIMGLVFY